MPNKRAKKKLTLAFDESGAAAIVIAIVFAALCGFAGLAWDIGHVVMVKAELQRTADAGALAGAMGLLPYNNPGSNQTPYWIQGENKAHDIINSPANKADNRIFTIAEVTVRHGYWKLKPPEGYVQPPLSDTRGAAADLPEPAITVTLSKEVTLYLAPMVNYPSTMSVRATATAILPEAYTTSKIIPIAVSYDTVFNNSGGTVLIDVNPQEVTVNSNKNEAGWFTMTANENFPQSVLNNPLTASTDLSATNIYLQPGAEVTLEHQLIHKGMVLVMPVVQTVKQKTMPPIIGFAAYQVDDVVGPNITGHFIDKYYDPNVVPTEETEGTGILSSVSGTPKLVGP